ncbi:MAG: hypothetical protein HY821_20825 [Acidobacteria bacterium]|nr:hypothetical protein [Acidobacteriota bacterium]
MPKEVVPRNGPVQPARFAQRFRQRILRQYFVRFHMGLLLTATTAAGLVSSKLLLLAGLHSVLWRYPIAVAFAYLTFFGLTRLWVAYVLTGGRLPIPSADGVSLDAGNIPIDLSSSSPGSSFSFAGGDSGGGGASSSWDAGSGPSLPSSSSSGGSWFPSLDLDIDFDEGIWILIALAILVAVIFASGAYLIYAAPTILPDIACNALLAGCVTGAARRAEQEGWASSVWRSTRLPFLLIFCLTLALAYAVHHTCPAAATLLQALACPDAPAN